MEDNVLTRTSLPLSGTVPFAIYSDTIQVLESQCPPYLPICSPLDFQMELLDDLCWGRRRCCSRVHFFLCPASWRMIKGDLWELSG